MASRIPQKILSVHAPNTLYIQVHAMKVKMKILTSFLDDTFGIHVGIFELFDRLKPITR